MPTHSVAAERAFLSVERRLVPLKRTVEARLVPTGTPTTIPEGTFVTLTQSLGGTYTVVHEGNMARIDGEDADALGFEPEVMSFDEPDDGKPSESQVWEALRSVHDPEIPVNIVDLGLIYSCRIDDARVSIVLVQDVERRVGVVPFVDDVNVELVFDPPWSRDRMTDEAQLELGLF